MPPSGTASGSDTGVRRLARCSSAPAPITKSTYRSAVTLPHASTPLQEVVVRIVQTQETSVSSRAGQPIAVRWRGEVEGITLSLTPSLLACAASGDDRRTQVEIVETYGAEDHLIRQIGLALLAEAETSEPVGRLEPDPWHRRSRCISSGTTASRVALLKCFGAGYRAQSATREGVHQRAFRGGFDFDRHRRRGRVEPVPFRARLQAGNESYPAAVPY